MEGNKTLVFGLCFVFLSGLVIKSQNNQDGHPAPSPLKSGYLEVPDGRLYYEVAGEGDGIVLVHDGNLYSMTWDEQFPVFSKDYKVVRYDRRGYGKSTYPEKAYSNIEDLGEMESRAGRRTGCARAAAP